MSDSPTRHWSLNTGQILFGLIFVMLSVIYVSVILAGPQGREPMVLIPFTVLMFTHALLYLVNPSPGTSVSSRLLYFVVRGVLATITILVADGMGLSMLLIFMVAGQVFYLFPGILSGVVTSLIFGLIWLAITYVLDGISMSTDTLMQGLIGLVFVGVYTSMFARHDQERQRAEELLRDLGLANKRLRAYADQVEALTLSQERQRMARDLHDTLAQGVAGLILQLEAVDGLLEQGDTARAQGVVQQAMARARTTLTDARRAIQALRAEPLGQGGLLDAIRDAVRDLTTTGTPCDLEVGDGEWDLPVPLAEHVLRIVQEGLTNVARHAQATHAAVRLSRDEASVRVEIQDDGEGFDSTVVGRDGRFGLLGLRERVQSVGGTLEIESAPGALRGTRLVVHLPLAVEEHDG